MTRPNPEVDFWLDVQQELETGFGMRANQAREAIDGYRHRMAEHGALEVTYHSEPHETAAAIHGGRFRMEPPRR